MGAWKFYRLDFESSTGQDAQSPVKSWEWDFGKNDWKQRGVADAVIDLTDANPAGSFYYQVDTSSTDLGSNLTTSADVNFAGLAVPFGSTAQFGGRIDNGSTGYYYEHKAIPNGIIKSVGVTDAPPAFKVRYDNNTTKAGYCTVLISFKTIF